MKRNVLAQDQRRENTSGRGRSQAQGLPAAAIAQKMKSKRKGRKLSKGRSLSGRY